MKVADLSGAALDYWVAMAEGLDIITKTYPGAFGPITHDRIRSGQGTRAIPAYAAEWRDGGPIIEREKIALHRVYDFDGNFVCWSGHVELFTPVHGPTPLIAAMRAYAASKFGDEVPPAIERNAETAKQEGHIKK